MSRFNRIVLQNYKVRLVYGQGMCLFKTSVELRFSVIKEFLPNLVVLLRLE